MSIRVRLDQIKLALGDEKSLLSKKSAKALGVPEEAIEHVEILRESLDARKKDAIIRVFSLAVQIKDNVRIRGKADVYRDEKYSVPAIGEERLVERPLVVGFGPAGMAAGLLLARSGYRPIILERGQPVAIRSEHVRLFWQKGELNEESNVQFGEGGAGTFSDGKLTCRTRDLRSRWFMARLVEAGAPEEILYQAKPHVGTDRLKDAVKNIRDQIIALGGEVRFGNRVQRVLTEEGKITGVEMADGTMIRSNAVIFAVGHSARDTFAMLLENGVSLSPKPFAVGFRIEHPQILIDNAQYGDSAGKHGIGPADYHLTHQTKNGRAVYTFCMCPGGYVVGAASESEHLVVNGMSYHARDGSNANSALLVTVTPEDFQSGPLGGVAFQREIERRAFVMGGGNYSAPIQKTTDFIAGIQTISIKGIEPTHEPGTTLANLAELFPPELTEALREGLTAMDAKLKGFAGEDSLLTGVETRSSSPLRINRDTATMESLSHKGLYPAGEGAGYAGGIISSAVDGMLAAEQIISKFNRPGQ